MGKHNNKRSKLNILLDFSILALIGIYAWMITDASRGQLTEYVGDFVIADSNVSVDFFMLINNTYVEQSQSPEEPLLTLKNLEPGSSQKFRFDVTNSAEVISISKIVFSDISGDLNLLKDDIIINCSNPTLFSFKLSDRLEYDEETNTYFIDFIDYIKFPANSTTQIFWSIGIDSDATNEIQNATLAIDKIMFIYP